MKGAPAFKEFLSTRDPFNTSGWSVANVDHYLAKSHYSERSYDKWLQLHFVLIDGLVKSSASDLFYSVARGKC